MKKILDFIQFGLKWTVLTNLGRILSLFALVVLFNNLQYYTTSVIVCNVLQYAFYITFGALLLYVLVFLIVAIYNVIMEAKRMKKQQEDFKKTL